MSRLLLCLTVLSGLAASLPAQAIRRLPGFEKKFIPANDDGSSTLVQLPFTINFFGRIRNSGYVNNNGNITFDAALATFTPFGLENTRREIIAAFFADVDTRNAASSLVYYGEDTIDGRRAFGVNYFNVGYFASHADKRNTFQIVLIERADTGSGNFDVEFNYETVQWETGDASGGAGGLGGVPAVVGWSNGSGDPGTSYELAGSLISGAFLDNGPRSLARRRLNSPVIGRYLFRARDGVLSPGLAITSSALLPKGVVGVPYIGNFTASGGTNPYRWSFFPDPGVTLPGLTLNTQGVLNGTPTARGIFAFTVSVTSRVDGADETISQRASVEIEAPSLFVDNRSCPLPDGIAGTPYSQTFRATGGAGPYVWSWGDGRSPVPGLTLAENGAVSGTPTVAGSYNFVVRVAGPASSEAKPGTRGCTLNIRAVATVPTVFGCPSEFGTVGVPYEGAVLASGGSAPWRWLAGGALPIGVTLSPDGKFNGIPGATGVYPYQLLGTDLAGRTIQTTCKFTIGSQALNIQNACPLPSTTTGETYSAALALTGGEGPYIWSLLGTLPPGITLQPNGLLSGAANDAGSWRFLLVARDRNGLTGSKSCSLIVNRSALSISACPLPDARLGQPYGQTLNTVGGTGPLRWTAETALPAGLMLLSAGQIAGTPITPGEASFRLRVADGAGNTSTQQCRIFVRPEPLEILRPCPLSDAQVGSFYREYTLGQGGVTPYRWRAEGRLPAGVSLGEDGRFSGTPAAAGTYPFTLVLEDSRRAEMRLGCEVRAKIPAIPDLQLSLQRDVTSNLPVDITLAKPYSLPISGELLLTAEANTGAADAEVNFADPAVQLLPNGRLVRFDIPAGARTMRFRLSTLGTVAARYRISVQKLTVAGQAQPTAVAPVQVDVPRSAPVLSDACYTTAGGTLIMQVTGQSSTREITNMSLELNGKTLSDTPAAAAALDYFSNPLTVRTGGAFRLDVPVLVEANGYDVQVTTLRVRVSNRVGSSAQRDVRRCN